MENSSVIATISSNFFCIALGTFSDFVGLLTIAPPCCDISIQFYFSISLSRKMRS
ncbi:hypothetical protein CKA32_000023 [Geitlerinema sp. FC II]|nr:hypothetical protein CKA32_000023 [Geitlerinema sp. FC II]